MLQSERREDCPMLADPCMISTERPYVAMLVECSDTCAGAYL